MVRAYQLSLQPVIILKVQKSSENKQLETQPPVPSLESMKDSTMPADTLAAELLALMAPDCGKATPFHANAVQEQASVECAAGQRLIGMNQ